MRRDLHVALIKIDMPIAVHRHNINLRINFMCQLLNLSQCPLQGRGGGGREKGGGGREEGGGGREEGGGGKGRKCEPSSPTPGQSLDPQLVVFNSYLQLGWLACMTVYMYVYIHAYVHTLQWIVR